MKRLRQARLKIVYGFSDFIATEQSGGIVLLVCAALSLMLTNAPIGSDYQHLWHTPVLARSLEFWINDGLMTIFFLQVGLEVEREMLAGELREWKKSSLPMLAALGGMLVPALIHFFFNAGLPTQRGFGIPMATDIAFSLGILSLLGKRVPLSFKIFLTALAIIDDVGAILVIALFYSSDFSWIYLGGAALVYGVLIVLNRSRVSSLWIYLTLGVVMWFCIYRSGIHPTITGVLLAFAIPFGPGKDAPSSILAHRLHRPVTFFILPLFALANTALVISSGVFADLQSANSLGIFFGLVLGKPIGIFLMTWLGAALGWCVLPANFRRRDLFGLGLLAGIGFTMSIFISLLAFREPALSDSSKIAVLAASFFSGVAGYWWLLSGSRKAN